jgi:hypothetical protein
LGPSGAVILKQLKREGNIAIYKRTKESTGKVEGYEVIRIRLRTGRGFSAGKGTYEVYPSAKEFGPYARHVMTLERAEQIFRDWTQP